jgi:signal transduction histidine kinase
VAERIATAFGGAIHVESMPGQGSRFELVLPEATARIPCSRDESLVTEG